MKSTKFISKYLIYLIFLIYAFLNLQCVPPEANQQKNKKNTLGMLYLLLNTEKEITVGGLKRNYLDYIPINLEEDPRVLLVFHGSGSKASEFRVALGPTLERMANEKKFILVYLSGYEGHFNDCRKKAAYSARKLNIDDKSLAKAIIHKLREETGKPLTSIYALGYSNGAQMTYRLALEEPDTYKGIIAVSANLPHPENMDCQIEDSKSGFPGVVIIQGTKDPINPTEGGDVSGVGVQSRGRVLSTSETAEWFAKKYSLKTDSPSPEDISLKRNLKAKKQVWKGENSGVMMVLLEGAGHTVPQEFFPFSMALGPTYQDNTILENAWNFLVGQTQK